MWGRGKGRGKERERILSWLHTEPDVELDPVTLGS